DDALCLATPHETSVLSHIQVRKRIPLPEGFGIAQGITGHPRLTSLRIDILPGLCALWVIVEDFVKTADVNLLLEQTGHLIVQPPRCHPVIITPVHEGLTACFLTGQIAFGPETLLPG